MTYTSHTQKHFRDLKPPFSVCEAVWLTSLYFTYTSVKTEIYKKEKENPWNVSKFPYFNVWEFLLHYYHLHICASFSQQRPIFQVLESGSSLADSSSYVSFAHHLMIVFALRAVRSYLKTKHTLHLLKLCWTANSAWESLNMS
jgi:hypothetical protein